MARWHTWLASFLAVAVTLTLAGCGGGEETAPADSEETAMAEEHDHEHGEGEGMHTHEGEEDDELTEEQRIEENLALLDEADRELAVAQKICPVGGEALGWMGKPYKTAVDDRTVFLCCEACDKQLQEDPEKFLAMLDAPADGDSGDADTESEATEPTDE